MIKIKMHQNKGYNYDKNASNELDQSYERIQK